MNKYQERLLWLEWLKRSADRDLQLKEVYKHYKELVEQATPPTEEEVCKALNCEYSKDDNMFYQEGEWGVCLTHNPYTGRIEIDFDNKQFSIAETMMIVRFFEEV